MLDFFLRRVWILGFTFFFSPSLARADIVLYSLPGGAAQLVLEGKTERLPGRMIQYMHPTYGKLIFAKETVEVIEFPSKKEQLAKIFDKAKKEQSIDGMMAAAKFALMRGLLEDFYRIASEAWKLDPTNPQVLRLVEARKAIKRKLSDPGPVIEEMKRIVARDQLKIEYSDHYVLMHDTSDAKLGKKKETRAKQRLDLLERVYESFLLKFALEGKVLPAPEQRMMVLLFADEKDYLHYVNLLDPELKNALGFWDPKTNLAVFFDQGTTESMRALQDLAADLQSQKQAVKNSTDSRTSGKYAQLSNTIEALSKIAAEERDIEVVSHEATHQLAGNAGLMPKGKLALAWAHEGLASYFETPDGGGWGGIGAVNKRRLRWYRMLEKETRISNVEFVISDSIFDAALTQDAKVAAYGQAWALTHFLMEFHFEKLMKYYERVGQIPIDEESEGIERKKLVTLFQEIFGDMKRIDGDWHDYMRKLRPDVEIAMIQKAQKP